MKISISRLKQLVPNSLSTEQVADALTMAGLEVEEVSPVAPAFSGIKIAEVVSVDAHPDAAKLKVCQVNAGEGAPLQIVCGAPNVATGMKVPFAVVGAKLPGLDIKAAKLRGVESFGMLCSARELGLSDDHGGLLALPADAPIGVDFRAWLDLDDDILTLKITPNRGDCLSMIGIARDFAAVTGLPLIPGKIEDVALTGNDLRAISIQAPEACGQYFGRAITGLNPQAQSPAWLTRRIERAGLRPISPLVDITNLVMIELGQPMHAFDQEKLKGNISVRFARAGESLRLLTGVDAKLDESMLLICDASGPVAIGGVMGGESTMCTDTTTSVFFESAWFAPDVIRGKAKALGINSDAAYRFERGVDPSSATSALEWATSMTREICGTEATHIGPVCSALGQLPLRNPVTVRPHRAERLIGMPIATEMQIDALKRVGCKVDKAGESLNATAPSHRFDLTIEEDFVEEIARIHGYARIPDRAPVSTLPMLQIPSNQGSKPALKIALARMGYHEAINYSFVDPDWETDFCGHANPPRLQNPIASHMAAMRSSLIGGMV
ncbi:MAG: phenylalanine--tRNA ligase subunit beta, partial [Betaproteobacteria bacterium]|nr:phenylalanine--tRNA ligase subunit beta [Betaproteobacteria bacterium]